MFTGIVRGRGKIHKIEKLPGLYKIDVELPAGAEEGVELGASIANDGVCLTVAHINGRIIRFDVMQETLNKTTLGTLKEGDEVNIERAAKDGQEVGGHLISGHIDTTVEVFKIEQPENNYVIHFKVPPQWMQYIFAKGYIALNGASLTIASVDKANSTFNVWLIPETMRLTTFGLKNVGQKINLEVERTTQVIVETVQRYLDDKLSSLIPALNQGNRELKSNPS
jgi:riboflavin synthase